MKKSELRTMIREELARKGQLNEAKVARINGETIAAVKREIESAFDQMSEDLNQVILDLIQGDPAYDDSFEHAFDYADQEVGNITDEIEKLTKTAQNKAAIILKKMKM